MTKLSTKSFIFQEGRIYTPVFMTLRLVAMVAAVVLLLLEKYFWNGNLLTAALLVALFGYFTLPELIRYGPLGRPMLFLSELELIVPRWSDSLRKERRVTLYDITEVVVSGPYDKRVVRFIHSDGTQDELSAFWWRGYGDRVITCLREVLPKEVEVRVEAPPTFMERTRGDS